MTRPKKSKTTRKAIEPSPAQQHSELMPEDRKAKLGEKYTCFSCGARFYDMNKPEPLCPKCGADQRKKPKTSDASPPTPAPAKRSQPRPLQILDDEEESVPFEEDVDLDIGDLGGEGEDDLFESEEGEASEAAEDDAEEL